MTDTLVAAAAGPQSSAFGGAYILQDGADLANAIQSGDWVMGGIAGFTSVMNGIGAVIDPIGTLIANGLGWVLDHIEPLRGWLEQLTGNAAEVAAFAQTWANVAGRLEQVGSELNARLGDLDGLSGETADAYRAHVRDLAANVSSTGTWAGAVGSGLQIASTLVQAVYELVRDAISQVVGVAISAAITTAATVGFGAPLAIGQVVTKVSALVGRIGSFVTKLLRSLGDVLPLFQRLGNVVEQVAAWLRGRLRGGAQPTTVRAAEVAPPPRQATLGHSESTNYRETFFDANPGVNPRETVVHHAVEQQVMRRYPDVLTPEQLHSLENLRGIPKSLNNSMHLSEIRIAWNEFYDTHPRGSTTLQDLLAYATELDNKFGHLFTPPIR